MQRLVDIRVNLILSYVKIHCSGGKYIAIRFRTSQKYLAIVATSTTSERLFSTAGNIITAKHSSSSMDNVNKLVLLHESLPAIHLPYKRIQCKYTESESDCEY